VPQQEEQALSRSLHDVVGDGQPEADELGDGMAEHRRLRDGGRLRPAPETRVRERPIAIAEVGHEAVRGLRRQRAAELDAGALVAEVRPHHRVEAAVPQPLPRVGDGVRHAVPTVGAGAPRRLEQAAGVGGKRRDGR
jgi:hypothetical protein